VEGGTAGCEEILMLHDHNKFCVMMMHGCLSYPRQGRDICECRDRRTEDTCAASASGQAPDFVWLNAHVNLSFAKLFYQHFKPFFVRFRPRSLTTNLRAQSVQRTV